jgi:hypothetical protein
VAVQRETRTLNFSSSPFAMPAASKRQLSPIDLCKTEKKARIKITNVIELSDDDDDLSVAAPTLKQRDPVRGRPRRQGWTDDQVIDVDQLEEEQAMKFSLGWASRDRQPSSSGSGSVARISESVAEDIKLKRTTLYMPVDLDTTPDIRLLQFRDLFVANRPCSNCHAIMKPPRGHVRVIFLRRSTNKCTYR